MKSPGRDQPLAWRQALFAGAVALALVGASGIPGLVDLDEFSHLSYARRLLDSGLRLRGHPFLPFTILGWSGVDLWWGFHRLLVPFTPLGDLWGARVAGAVFATLSAGAIAYLLYRAGGRTSWPFAVAPFAISIRASRSLAPSRMGSCTCRRRPRRSSPRRALVGGRSCARARAAAGSRALHAVRRTPQPARTGAAAGGPSGRTPARSCWRWAPRSYLARPGPVSC